MAIAASDAAIICQLCIFELSLRSFTRSLVDMTPPNSTFEGEWAEIARDPANQLAQIDWNMFTAGQRYLPRCCRCFSGETHSRGRWRPGFAEPSGVHGGVIDAIAVSGACANRRGWARVSATLDGCMTTARCRTFSSEKIGLREGSTAAYTGLLATMDG